MSRFFRVVALVVASALAAPAVAQVAAPVVGVAVKDAKGQTVGVVDKVVARPDGRPLQVLVRSGGVLRPLPVEGLTAQSGAYVMVLTKAEFEALPGVQ